MKQLLRTIVTAALLLFPSVVLAQSSQSADPYARLALAFTSEESEQSSFDNLLTTQIGPAYKQEPSIKQLEELCPDFVDGLLPTIAPILREAHGEKYATYRGEAEALFREDMKLEQAREAADFFESSTGKAFFDLIVANNSRGNMLAQLMQDPDADVSLEAYVADREESLEGFRRDVSSTKLVKLGEIFRDSNWFPAFRALVPKFRELDLNTINRGTSPELESRLVETYESFATTHIQQCQSRR